MMDSEADITPKSPTQRLGGIPFEEIVQRSNSGETFGDVRGTSGRDLRYSVTENSIQINDKTEFGSLLLATVDGETIRFALHVKSFKGDRNQRHPDFRAREFIKFALQYFENRGRKISTFEARWQPDSDNYKVFQEKLKETENKKLAAQATWSGQAMGEHGFTEINENEIIMNPEQIQVFFHRPSPQAQ